MNWLPLFITFKLALITSIVLLLVCVPLAYKISSYSKWNSAIWESLFSLPLVLPPTVIGFYLLQAFSPNNPFGDFVKNTIGFEVLFSFEGLVFGSILYNFPFMFQPILNGFRKIPQQLLHASYLMGKSKIKTFFHISLPFIQKSILSGFIMAFAHTVGEFGVVLMIGGNIPGLTQVASIAIYDQVEMMNFASAHYYSITLLIFSFVILFLMFILQRKDRVNDTY
ncbi:molybdate ABC transporter permease subunit [Flammeovirga yaeyamensis]|uniref:Molybdenum transport system permease n=1 Tax=Flammeovirga yaeyamensis TaxID=367791 RepID=A0AAX1MZ19_9BACT|nr:molybdate ABC transporter permease subunit [Flammeovirga yaeyamensis]MBB3696001.1 molybdate transport system permease protein [Flammeovirga yaeyamensis]NMF34687.1 molybdate ABC transporter permease subunit [Flammeovirga yaeyamensis]QWG00484.1 molybdate ABC transporter permease subunit [Flammeovirga yaeyamensis]